MGEVPPLVGVAVNVTEVPLQILVCDAATETEGVTLEFMVIVILFEVAGLPVTPERFDVITQVITLPVVKVVVV